MGQAKHQKKNSEIDNEHALKKKSEQQGNEATVDLPGIVQRITNRNNPRQADILHLQRTFGNRKTQRMLGITSVGAVASGTIQRHVSPESEAMYGQSLAQETAAKDQTKSSLKNAESGAKGMLAGWNSLQNAFTAARVLPAGGSEEQSPQGSDDTYEG
jgi:hypothetical protein